MSEVVGRDEIVAYIRETLLQQSVLLNAERRIGRTTILNMLRANPPDGWVTVWQDLEKIHTAAEFAKAIYQEVEKFLSFRSKSARRTRRLLKSIGGTTVHGVITLPDSLKDVPWKDVLISAIKDAVEERSDQEEKLLFLWDEVPFMLQNIACHDGELVAMEVLDVLRSLRQTYGAKGLRMVLTGSIGLHHAVFTPSRTSPEDLEAINVQREDLLVDALERIREGAYTGHKHHLLYIGSRGTGKTHLLSLLQHRVH